MAAGLRRRLDTQPPDRTRLPCVHCSHCCHNPEHSIHTRQQHPADSLSISHPAIQLPQLVYFIYQMVNFSLFVCQGCNHYSLITRLITSTHTDTHSFNGPLSRTTRVARFTEARDSEWKWHQLGHMQVSTSFQTDNHASTPAGPSCCRTNSVKALKAKASTSVLNYSKWVILGVFAPQQPYAVAVSVIHGMEQSTTSRLLHAKVHPHRAGLSVGLKNPKINQFQTKFRNINALNWVFLWHYCDKIQSSQRVQY